MPEHLPINRAFFPEKTNLFLVNSKTAEKNTFSLHAIPHGTSMKPRIPPPHSLLRHHLLLLLLKYTEAETSSSLTA
jgi:hypothetical protein